MILDAEGRFLARNIFPLNLNLLLEALSYYHFSLDMSIVICYYDEP